MTLGIADGDEVALFADGFNPRVPIELVAHGDLPGGRPDVLHLPGIIDEARGSSSAVPFADKQPRTQRRLDGPGQSANFPDLPEEGLVFGLQKAAVEDRVVVVDIDVDGPGADER